MKTRLTLLIMTLALALAFMPSLAPAQGGAANAPAEALRSYFDLIKSNDFAEAMKFIPPESAQTILSRSLNRSKNPEDIKGSADWAKLIAGNKSLQKRFPYFSKKQFDYRVSYAVVIDNYARVYYSYSLPEFTPTDAYQDMQFIEGRWRIAYE
ncbi:MAG: hypothetical protein JKX97_03740 [Candidatus Lindowbacteria bacterium]|nr:hypothetical protein [Candidatus Lindowbacteria bacterium]